jgi:prostaglandin-E synthase
MNTPLLSSKILLKRIIAAINYDFKIDLYSPILKENTTIGTQSRSISITLKKKEKGPHWPRLTASKTKLNWLKTDWDLYIDEEKEDDLDLNLGKDELPDEPSSDEEYFKEDNLNQRKESIKKI